MNTRLKLLVTALLLLTLSIPSGAIGEAALSFPALVETDCVWDDSGNLISETAHDLSGRPALNARGFYRAEYTYDDHSNELSVAYFGLNGEPVAIDDGFARAEYTYQADSKGAYHLITEDRYAADGSRADIPGSYSYRRDAWEGDQILSTEYFDAAGQLTRPTGGFARITYEVAETDQLRTITKRYLNDDGTPLIGTEGGAAVVTEYSGAKTPVSGLLLSTQIYGLRGDKVLGARRWNREVNTYDEKGNLTRTDYYGIDDERILCTAGYASVTHTYDELNRVVETAYLNIDDSLIKRMDGYAKVTTEYYGGSTLKHWETFYGADGEKTMITYGYSMIEYEYDQPEFDYRETFYNTVGDYTMSQGGYARREVLWRRSLVRDKDNKDHWVTYPDQVHQEKYFGTDLKLIQVKAGYSGLVNDYNENGQVTKTTYMDHDWKPARNDERQFASIEYKYEGTDPLEPPVYEAYFDKDGKPVQSLDGSYVRTMTYGGPKKNLLLAEEFYDAAGNPSTSVVNGAHRVEYTYSKGLEQATARYYAVNGQPCMSKRGYAILLSEYNRMGKLSIPQASTPRRDIPMMCLITTPAKSISAPTVPR